MEPSISISLKQPSRLLPLLIMLLGILTTIYLYHAFQKSQPLSLQKRLEKTIGIEAPSEVYREAIAYAAKNLAVELDISLENYDLSQEEYNAIVEEAATKFGNCNQYRLYALAPRPYSCFTCVSRPIVSLRKGQTYKIGQTCGTKQTRYASGLPEPGLFYLVEFRGNIFDVLVAEYVKLLLFQYSKERQDILNNNNLQPLEMPLPPGNKILR